MPRWLAQLLLWLERWVQLHQFWSLDTSWLCFLNVKADILNCQIPIKK
jgi:hypothetical protein